MRAVVVVALVLMGGCRGAEVHSMARTTRLADMRFADEYTYASRTCLASSDNWDEYDTCMAPWQSAYEAMRALISTTLTLDVASGRDGHRQAACRWYRTLQVVDATAPVPLPSVEAGLDSKWKNRCGKP